MRIGKFMLLLALALQPVSGPATADEQAPTGLQAHPDCMVVLLFDDHCKTFCEKVRPILKEVKDKYGERILYVELNTAQKALKDSKQQAKELGVLSFLADYGDFVPYVGIFDKRRKLVKELQGVKEKDIYFKAIDKALSRT